MIRTKGQVALLKLITYRINPRLLSEAFQVIQVCKDNLCQTSINLVKIMLSVTKVQIRNKTQEESRNMEIKKIHIVYKFNLMLESSLTHQKYIIQFQIKVIQEVLMKQDQCTITQASVWDNASKVIIFKLTMILKWMKEIHIHMNQVLIFIAQEGHLIIKIDFDLQNYSQLMKRNTKLQ